jgi:hypothetical protein
LVFLKWALLIRHLNPSWKQLLERAALLSLSPPTKKECHQGKEMDNLTQNLASVYLHFISLFNISAKWLHSLVKVFSPYCRVFQSINFKTCYKNNIQFSFFSGETSSLEVCSCDYLAIKYQHLYTERVILQWDLNPQTFYNCHCQLRQVSLAEITIKIHQDLKHW